MSFRIGSEGDTVADLKQKIFEIFSIAVERQRLFCCNDRSNLRGCEREIDEDWKPASAYTGDDATFLLILSDSWLHVDFDRHEAVVSPPQPCTSDAFEKVLDYMYAAHVQGSAASSGPADGEGMVRTPRHELLPELWYAGCPALSSPSPQGFNSA